MKRYLLATVLVAGVFTSESGGGSAQVFKSKD